MTSANKPCLNPNLCGVQSHRPGTIAKCTVAIMSQQRDIGIGAPITATAGQRLTKGQKMFLHEWVPAMMLDAEIDRCVEGIVNGYQSEDEREGFEDALMNRISSLGANVDEEHWVAFNAIISNKEMPPRAKEDTKPFGNEHITRSEVLGQPALKIEAGDRGGYLAEVSDYYGDGFNGLYILADRDAEEGLGFDETSCAVYQNSDGELWITSNNVPGHKFGSPMKIKELREGDRHWVQDDNDEPEGEHAYYELARRLYSNPVTRRYLETHAPVSDPGLDDRYDMEWDGAYHYPPRKDQ